MHRCIALLWLFAVCNLHAEVLKVESIEFKAKKTNIDFGEPINLPFVSASQPKIGKKINDYIYINSLRTLAPTNAKDGISRKITEADDDPIAGVTSMQHKVLLNNGKVFSLQLNTELCGAYCEDNAINYGFDAATGRHLTLQDIFTVNGIETLKKKVYTVRVATMQQEIKRLQKQLVKKPVKHSNAKDDEFEPDAADQILLYQTCLAEDAEVQKDEMKSGDHHELDDFLIDANGITFSHERCSNQLCAHLIQLTSFIIVILFNHLRKI